MICVVNNVLVAGKPTTVEFRASRNHVKCSARGQGDLFVFRDFNEKGKFVGYSVGRGNGFTSTRTFDEAKKAFAFGVRRLWN